MSIDKINVDRNAESICYVIRRVSNFSSYAIYLRIKYGVSEKCSIKKLAVGSFLLWFMGAFTSRLTGSTDAAHAYACTADCGRQLRTRRALIVRD